MKLLASAPVAALALLVTGCASAPSSAGRPEPFPRHGSVRVATRPAPVAPAIAASDLMATALAQRGVPYRLGGADPQGGFDCSGLMQFVFNRYAVSLPRTVAEQFHVGTPIDRNDIQPGDLVFFSTTAPGATHVGLVLDDVRFLHAPGTGAVVRVERFDTPYWSPRLLGIRRLISTMSMARH